MAAPSSAAHLLQECLEKLAAQVQQLMAACTPHSSSPRALRGADDDSTTMRLLKDSVLGFAQGSAALVSASTRSGAHASSLRREKLPCSRAPAVLSDQCNFISMRATWFCYACIAVCRMSLAWSAALSAICRILLQSHVSKTSFP